MDNKRNVATKTLLVLSCAFLLGLTSCTKKHHPSSDTTSSAPISETTSESTSESTSDTTTSEGTSDSTTSEVPSSDVSSGDTSSENPSSEEVLLNFGENVKLSDKTVTYNGEEQTLTVENLPQGAVVTYEGTHKFTNAGEYTIRATVSKEGYNDKVVSAKLTIAKAKVEVPTAKTNLVYTGEAIVGVEANALYTVTGGSAVEAGTHEATVTLKDTTNYEWASEFDGKVSYTIAKAEISVSGVTAPEMSVVDTGSAINFVVNGVPSNVKATVTYYSDEAMTTPVSEARGVGVYFVKVELSSTSANHTLVGTTTLTSKLTIRENNTGVTFAGATFTYDGTEKTIAVDMTNAKTDGDFEVTYFIDAECTTPFTTATNAGTYNVYAKVVDKNQVYSETVLPATLTINKVAVKVVVQNKEVTYNQDAPTFTYEVEGLVNGESAERVITGTPTFTCGYVKGSNVGTYDITLTGLDADNYELAYYKGTLTVNKAEVNVPEAKTDLVYNGSAQVGVEENALYTVTGGSAVEAGTHKATVALVDASNYEWANAEFNGEVQYEIAKADVDLSKVAVVGLGEENATTYDGTVKKVTVTGLPEGVFSASVEYFADAEHTIPVSECKNASTYYVVVTFNQEDKNNYKDTSKEPVTGELIIKQKVLSVTWEGTTEYFYDGTEKTTPTCAIKEGQVITGDEVSLEVSKLSFLLVDKYEFTLTLNGAQAKNYVIDNSNDTFLAEIKEPLGIHSIGDWSRLEEGDYALVFGKNDTYFALTSVPKNIPGTGTIKSDVCGSSFTSIEEATIDNTNTWHISKTENGYYISVGEKYLSFVDGKSYLKLADSKETATVWSITQNNSGSYYFYAITSDGKNKGLIYNGTGTNSAVGFYASSNADANGYGLISLYRVFNGSKVDFTVGDTTGGSINVISTNGGLTGLYTNADSLTITLTPEEGKMLKSLSLVSGETTLPLEAVKNADGTYTYIGMPSQGGQIVAVFDVLNVHKVNVEANEHVEIISGLVDECEVGQPVTLKLSVPETYSLDKVVVKGVETNIELTADGTNTYSFTMPSEDVTISFVVTEKVLVTINAAENTSILVSSNDGSVSTGDYIEKGSELDIKAIGNILGYNATFTVTGASLNEETGKYKVTDAVTITSSAIEVTETTKISEVISAADTLGVKVSSTNQVKVTGVVTSSTGYSENYGNYSEIVISDTTGSITLFRAVKGANNIDLVVGDTVTAIGYFVKFQYSNSSPIIYELSNYNNISPTIVAANHNEYAISSSIVDGEGNPSTNATISGLPESGKANSGDTVSFTVNPSSGYKVGNVKVNDENIAAVAGTYSFIVSKAMSIEIVVVSESTKVVSTIWSTDFSDSNRDTSTPNNYTISHEYVTTEKDTNKKVTWSLKCGSSGGGADMILPSDGNYLIRARMTKNKTNPSATITSSVLTLNSYIESFAFSYTLKNNTTLKVSYSLDGGTTWIEGKTYSKSASSLTSDIIEIKKETTSGLCVKFEFAYSGTPGSNQDCDIDDISVSGYSLL